MKNKTKHTLCVLLILIVFGGLGYSIAISFFNEPTLEEKFYDCKITAWEDCGLIVYENESLMCYQIIEQNDTENKWENCQGVSQKVSDCWRVAKTICEEKYLPSQNKSLINESLNEK